MHIAPATQSEKLKEFSLRLNQAVEADSVNWRLPAWLVAMIVAFIKEIAESFAELAKLLREGKITLQPAAPRQGTKRRAGTPSKRVAAARQARSPRPVSEAAEQPAAAWRTQLLCDAPEVERQTAPIPPAPPPEPPPTAPAAERLRGSIPLASGPPIQIRAWDKHLPRHALIVTIS
jgi:hypothetical protein